MNIISESISGVVIFSLFNLFKVIPKIRNSVFTERKFPSGKKGFFELNYWTEIFVWKFFYFSPHLLFHHLHSGFYLDCGEKEKKESDGHTHTSSPPTHAHTRTHAHAHTEKERERENVPLSFLLLSDSFKMIWEWGIME